MAPSRRKSASKKAAAEAARRQWKVGDLVLAKVKGFPAWPATVSEPEAWGYKADKKKILVYFFGTKEIAFCHPVDVEPFTEEKKATIQIKRPGRSADFLRAAQEIVECFEKLKEEGVDNKLESGEAPLENPTVSSADVKNSALSTESPSSRLNDCGFVNGKVERSPDIEGCSGSKDFEAFQGTENPEEPSKEILGPEFPDKTFPNIKRTWRTRSTQPEGLQQAKASVQRPQSSLKFDSFHIVNGSGSSHDCNNCVNEGPRNGYLDQSTRRHKRKKQSLGPLVQGVGESMVHDSNGNVEDNSSEASMGDSDAFSNYEDSAVQSNPDNRLSKYLVNSYQGDYNVSKRLDFDMNTVVLRKKRNPGRKRVAVDVAESVAPPDLEAKSNTQRLLPTERDNSDRNPKEDGDEHLPLVKRARVRMGKTPSADEQMKVHIEKEKPSDSSACILHVNSTLDSAVDNGPEKCSLNAMDSSVYSSPSDGSPTVLEDKPLVCEVRKGQMFSCSYDGEAALPPSKRLHRALEAMSANAEEEGRPSAVASSCIEEDTDGCNNDSKKCSPKILKLEEFLSEHDKSSNHNVAPLVDALKPNVSSDPSAVEGHTVVDSNVTNNLVENTEHKKNDHKQYNVEEVQDSSVEAHRGAGAVVGASDSVHRVDCSLKLMNSPDGGESNLVLDQCGLNQLPVDGEKEVDSFAKLHSSTTEDRSGLDQSIESEMRTDPVSGGVVVDRIKGEDGTKEGENPKPIDILKAVREETPSKNLEPSTEDKFQAASMCEAVKESTHLPLVSKASSPVLVVTTPRVSCLTSVSTAKSIDQVVRNSPVGGNIPKGVSPPNRFAMASDSSNIGQHQDRCVPDASFPDEKHVSDLDEHTKYSSEVSCSVKSSNKSSNNTESSNKSSNNTESSNKSSNSTEVKVALASFETALGTLSRTKESISRATRIAIDCAKFGIATEVLETLAGYLERESSLYRRVDLFFLVDSIAQCSRGLKGSICDAYTSAIQATLPRLLSAAAPGGYATRDNRRQCLKVLKLWQERRILPESIIRQHIRDLDSHGSSSSTGGYSRRMLRTERSFDDPIREMEGMDVDEYGSNSSFQLPGFCMPRMVRVEDDGSDSDEGSFEALTPEHETSIPGKGEVSDLPTMEKRRHILEDVDGELEMEDAAPSCEVETSQSVSPTRTDPAHASFVPLLPRDIHPPAPPPSQSPPPPPPPPPPMVLAPLPPPPPPMVLPPPPPPSPPPVMYQSAMPHVDSQDHLRRHNVQEAMPIYPPPRATSQMQMTDASPSCSYNSYSVAHNSVRPGYDSYHGDPSFHHNNAYHLRPPNMPPSNQFSYFHGEHRVGPHRDPPEPSYGGEWSRFPPTTEGAHFHGERERSRSGAHEYAEDWRFSRPTYHGSHHTEKPRGYEAPYSHPSRESSRANNHHGWGYRPRPVHHRYHGSSRNFPEGPPPTGTRAPPGFWPPR